MRVEKVIVEEWDYPDYIVHYKLIDRGWTEELIKQFLPIPSLILSNPYNKLQRMRLYHKENIFSIEKTDNFKNAVIDQLGKMPLFQHFKHLNNHRNAERRINRKKDLDDIFPQRS
jgi:hypothetical protein